MQIGDAVIAVGEVSESDFEVDGEDFVHARIGDVGAVVDVHEDDLVSVRWEKTGTVAEVHKAEIASVAASVPHPMAGFLRLVS